MSLVWIWFNQRYDYDTHTKMEKTVFHGYKWVFINLHVAYIGRDFGVEWHETKTVIWHFGDRNNVTTLFTLKQ